MKTVDATFKAPAPPVDTAFTPLPVALPLVFGPAGVAVAEPDPVSNVVVDVELALEVELVLAVEFRTAQISAGIVEKAVFISTTPDTV